MSLLSSLSSNGLNCSSLQGKAYCYGFLSLLFAGLCRRLKFSAKIDGYALQGHVIKNLSIFGGPTMRTACTNRCIMEPVCVSVNIGPSTKDRVTCELSNSDQMEHPEDLKLREGFMFIGTEVI